MTTALEPLGLQITCPTCDGESVGRTPYDPQDGCACNTCDDTGYLTHEDGEAEAAACDRCDAEILLGEGAKVGILRDGPDGVVCCAACCDDPSNEQVVGIAFLD